jgi:hypothetical protein
MILVENHGEEKVTPTEQRGGQVTVTANETANQIREAQPCFKRA